jgi:type IV fimbrial biogenesis protein FimT
MSEQGHTLIELIVVLGTVGLSAVLGAEALLSVMPRSERQAAIAELSVEVRRAHQLAITRRDRIRIVFDHALQVMRIERADEPRVLIRQYDYSRRNVASIQISKASSIVFYPSGRSATPATIRLITRHGEVAQITVSITGKVTWT